MLCSGASGFVQLAIDRDTNEQVAVKFIERAGHTSQRIIARELLNHRECAMHPHIIQLKVTSMLLRGTSAWASVSCRSAASGPQIECSGCVATSRVAPAAEGVIEDVVTCRGHFHHNIH